MSTQNNIVWYNRSDTAYAIWDNNFQKQVSNNQGPLGVSDGELEEIQDADTAYQTALEALIEAKAAYEAAVINKNTTKQYSIDVNRKYVAQFQVIPGLSEEIFQSLDIPARGTTGSKSPASTPTNLTAFTETNGNVTVKYSRGANSKTTTFTIQKSTNGGTTWSSIYSSNRTRATLMGLSVVPTQFRVFATRNGTISAPTQPVKVWSNDGSSSVELSLAS